MPLSPSQHRTHAMKLLPTSARTASKFMSLARLAKNSGSDDEIVDATDQGERTRSGGCRTRRGALKS